ncbi:hypothetical protein [Rhodovulum sp. YEN HP10]|uniref:hypothetical protein n=1 Tax=Rhodovulum sp. HP10 TaxID=3387397 RepID=UPI0039E19635
MTPDHTQKGKAETSTHRRASKLPLSVPELARRAPVLVVPALAVAIAAVTGLVTVLAVQPAPDGTSRAPVAAFALDRDATPVDGAVLLAGTGDEAAIPGDPAPRPAAIARPAAAPLPADGIGVVTEARAEQGRQAARALLAAGGQVFAGAPRIVPPARSGAAAGGDDLAGLRPQQRPLAGSDLRRPRPRPATAESAAPETVIAQASDRPQPHPDGLPAPMSGPATAVALARAQVRPQSRPLELAEDLSGASLVPAAGIELALAASPVPPAGAEVEAEAAVDAQGLEASLRPQTRPAALARLARGALVPDSRDLATPRAEPFAHTDIARGANGCSVRLARGIPGRPRGALSGSAIGARMDSLHGGDRDAQIVQQALAGNIPHFLRELTPVRVSGRLADGSRADVTICVTPDYLALGSDADFVRVPMGLPAAARIADRFGFLLPTTRMVDAIYGQARMRLAPRPMDPGAQMSSTRYFLQHNRTVESQTGGREGQLTAGQKKDLVLTNRLRSHPGRVAIYGWHKPDGHPIQPLSTVHGAYYSDYSHGVRLVSQTAFVNGRPVSLASLLANPSYAGLLTGEGPIAAPERLMASLYR